MRCVEGCEICAMLLRSVMLCRGGLLCTGAHAGCIVPTHPRRIGELLAQRAQQAGLSGVHWRRRHGEQFHGKRKALIDSMRVAGLPLI